MYLVNNKNDILIYDKTEHLIKLVKHYCGCNIEAIFCDSKKKLEELNLNTIRTAFIASADSSDLLDIVSVYYSVDKLYVNTQSQELIEKLKILQGVVFFDLKNDKFIIMDQIFNTIIDFSLSK